MNSHKISTFKSNVCADQQDKKLNGKSFTDGEKSSFPTGQLLHSQKWTRSLAVRKSHGNSGASEILPRFSAHSKIRQRTSGVLSSHFCHYAHIPGLPKFSHITTPLSETAFLSHFLPDKLLLFLHIKFRLHSKSFQFFPRSLPKPIVQTSHHIIQYCIHLSILISWGQGL